MSKISDALINRAYIAKNTLEPLFVKEFEAVCFEFYVDELQNSAVVFVESNIDRTDKYFKLDFESMPNEWLIYSDDRLKKYFEKIFETLKETPLNRDEAFDDYMLYEVY